MAQIIRVDIHIYMFISSGLIYIFIYLYIMCERLDVQWVSDLNNTISDQC